MIDVSLHTLQLGSYPNGLPDPKGSLSSGAGVASNGLPGSANASGRGDMAEERKQISAQTAEVTCTELRTPS
jgi:hypothetical protein